MERVHVLKNGESEYSSPITIRPDQICVASEILDLTVPRTEASARGLKDPALNRFDSEVLHQGFDTLASECGYRDLQITCRLGTSDNVDSPHHVNLYCTTILLILRFLAAIDALFNL